MGFDFMKCCLLLLRCGVFRRVVFCLLRFYFSASNLQSFLVEFVENFLLIAAAHQSDSSWDFIFFGGGALIS